MPKYLNVTKNRRVASEWIGYYVVDGYAVACVCSGIAACAAFATEHGYAGYMLVPTPPKEWLLSNLVVPEV